MRWIQSKLKKMHITSKLRKATGQLAVRNIFRNGPGILEQASVTSTVRLSPLLPFILWLTTTSRHPSLSQCCATPCSSSSNVLCLSRNTIFSPWEVSLWAEISLSKLQHMVSYPQWGTRVLKSLCRCFCKWMSITGIQTQCVFSELQLVKQLR